MTSPAAQEQTCGSTIGAGTDLPADGLRAALAGASPERTPQWRAWVTSA